MDFWRTAKILGNRKWFILLSVIVTVALTWGATRLTGSKWMATVQFVSPQNAMLTAGQNQENGSGSDSSEAGIEAARSQAIIYNAIVKSRDVLEPSLKSLDQRQLPPNLLKNIEFTTTAPRLYQLQVTDSSPQRSRQLANALADNFVKVYHDVRTQQAKKTVTLLEEQLKDADGKLAKARRSYDNYRDKYHIVGSLNASVDTALARLRDTRQRHDDVEQKIADAQARQHRLEAELAKTPASIAIETPVPAVTPAVSPLQTELTKAEAQLADLQKRYTDDMPVVQKAKTARDQIAARIQEEAAARTGAAVKTEQANPALTSIKNETHALDQEIAGYQALEKTLAASTVQAQTEIDQYKGIDSPLGVLAMEVAAQSEARTTLSARLRNARMMLDATESQNPITIMDRVNDFNPPINSTAGRSTKLLIIAALCALLLTSGLVIGLDTVDQRLRTVKEAEIALPAPVLAAIPQPMDDVTYSTLARATLLFPQSLHSEAYRFLALQFLNNHYPAVRSLMVVSAKAEQGATTALTNLGITLAQAGKKVILVDANIRTSEMHQVFELPNQFGYMDLLNSPDDNAIEEALHETGVPGLQVITSGHQPHNPWEAFRSPNVREVSRKLRERADIILYDTPSSILFTDALNLAPVVDASFLCVRALEPITGAEDRLVKLLQDAHVPVLGCVLNDVPASVVEGYDNYQHYYRSLANSAQASMARETASLAIPGGPKMQPWIDIPLDDIPLEKSRRNEDG